MVTIPPYTTYGDWPMKDSRVHSIGCWGYYPLLKIYQWDLWRSFPINNWPYPIDFWWPQLFWPSWPSRPWWSISQPQNDLRRFAAISPALKRRPKRAQNALFWGSATTCPRVWRSRCKRRRFLGQNQLMRLEGASNGLDTLLKIIKRKDPRIDGVW